MQLAGAGILGVGIWVKVDSGSILSFLQNIQGAPGELGQVLNVGYLLIAVGAVLLILGFLGCCGAVKESRCMLLLVRQSTLKPHIMFLTMCTPLEIKLLIWHLWLYEEPLTSKEPFHSTKGYLDDSNVLYIKKKKVTLKKVEFIRKVI